MMVKNMKEDDEFEMLLGEIPHATSLSLHHHHHLVNGNHYGMGNASVVNRMLYGMYDDDVSCGYSQHTYEENFIDQFGRMCINQEQNQGLICHNQINPTLFGDFDYLEANPHFSRIPMDSEKFYRNVLNYGYQPGVRAQIGINSMDEMMQNVPYMLPTKAKIYPNYDPYRFHLAAGGSSNIRIPRGELRFGRGIDGLSTCEDSLIIQGEDVRRVRKKFVRPCENGQTCSSLLIRAQRYILAMAKDQHGCRLLQKIFDDGNPENVQIVFGEIIGHVVELMINPFGNYLMQKLLEVCNEEQRMHILTAVTREPMELVQISLNTHGTRVVQKLIETLKTSQQVKLVRSAIEPGFLALIKDLNGNHVIQRCLHCLSNEDNKFIFEAAAKFCVEIATHQHGCCVLQRCINYSTGEYREKLVLEISRNGLLLAQDAFGNYVVQYILELQIPSAVSKLTSQFKGNYVQLATQKFSSHVVEKCLAVLDGQIRSTIVHELISATHFEQLLQDPHANYVVQTALRVTEGALHNSLVNVIESHKAISRNSPYSKRIFSHKLLKM
ncbi:putative armadillo-like helical, pumilio domain-containing protein [Helianthus debilis subsp. tardiflorus]